MSINGPSTSLSSLYNNPQLIGSLLPGINMQAIQSAFTAEQLQVQQPLNMLSTQEQALSAPLAAWQTLRGDLQTLQTDAASLSGTSLYQDVSATSSNASDVAAQGTGAGSPGTYSVGVNNLIQAEIDNSAGQASQNTALGLQGSFSVNGTTVQVSSGDTLAQIAAAINGAGAGVTATVLDTGGSNPYVLNLASVEGKAITWSDGNGILAGLGVLGSGGTPANQIQSAQAASYSINGVTLSSPTNSDTTSIPGVTLSLLNATPAGSPVTVSVAQNSSAIQSAVQQFATDFNHYLADSQKYLGKGGALEGNGTLTAVNDQLMQSLTGSVPGQSSAMADLAQAGVSLSAPVGSPQDFAMAVDSSTLQTALAANPSAFASLWNGSDGIGTQVNNLLTAALGSDGGVTSAIQDLQQQQSTLQTEITSPTSAVNQIVNAQLNALQQQFNQMMQSLVSLNQQGAVISQFAAQSSSSSGSSSSSSGSTGG